MAKKSEIAKSNEETSLVSLFGGETLTGFENTTSDDFSIPFLKLLQKMSPEVDPDDGAYIQGAKAGMFFNTSTGEVYEHVDFIPCFYRRLIVEWRDRESGGGFVSQHEPGYEGNFSRDESGRWVTSDGTYLSDTRYFFGLAVNENNDLIPTVIPFTSTQIKKSRTWITRMQSMKLTLPDGSKKLLPIYSHIWRISSVSEENDKGSWKGYKIDLVGPITDVSVRDQAKEANRIFQKNSSKIRPIEDGIVSKNETDVPF